MAQPAYICAASYDSFTTVNSDVDDILDRLDTVLAAAGWTVAAPGGPYTTPADADGRYFKLTFTRVSATRLSCVMTDDQLRATGSRGMEITGVQTINLYYSTKYLYIVNTGQEDTIYATLLSLYPESETIHHNYCVFFGTRETAGWARNNNICGNNIQVRADTGAYLTQGTPTTYTFLDYGSEGGSNYCTATRHASGARRWYPVWTLGQDGSSVYRLRGRYYNALIMHYSWVTIGTEYTVPIDEATTAIFKVLNMTQNTNNQYYMAVRKS